MMSRKTKVSRRGKRQAVLGLTICLVAAVVATGIYTINSVKQGSEDRKNQQQVRNNENDGEERRRSEAVNSTARKAEPKIVIEEKTTEPIQPQPEVPVKQAPKISFSENSRLLWPVDGNVIMSYSMDKTVYFHTLDQYKYNPAMVIKGAVNDQVISAAPGVIKTIDESPVTGNTVTVDMGDGYECIYGQLKDVAVKTGDYVEAGSVLGYVSEPSKYYSLEGSNLYFEMRKEGQPVNPVDYMSEE